MAGLVGVTVGVEGIPFGVQLDGFYGQSIGDQSQVGNDVRTDFLGGLIGGQYTLGGPTSAVRPYFLGQVGMTNVKLHLGLLDDAQTKFTFAGGGGLTVRVGSAHLFIEGQYLSIQTTTSSSNMIPVIVGLHLGSGM